MTSATPQRAPFSKSLFNAILLLVRGSLWSVTPSKEVRTSLRPSEGWFSRPLFLSLFSLRRSPHVMRVVERVEGSSTWSSAGSAHRHTCRVQTSSCVSEDSSSSPTPTDLIPRISLLTRSERSGVGATRTMRRRELCRSPNNPPSSTSQFPFARNRPVPRPHPCFQIPATAHPRLGFFFFRLSTP